MIRFRTGQSWRRERAGEPIDSFGLELEGVDLLAGASAERLDVLVPELVEAVGALWSGSSDLAQLSLPEVHWVLGFERDGTDVLLHVISLARPARRLRPPVRVELAELAQAAEQCGRQLLAEASDDQLGPRRRRALARGVERLARAPAEPDERARPPYEGEAAPVETGFGLRLDDRSDLSGRLADVHQGALTSLLARGRVWLQGETGELWAAETEVYLLLLELTRQAAELAHAIELREPTFVLDPSGAGPRLTVHLADAELEVGGARHRFEPDRLVRELYNAGLALLPMFRAHHPLQAKNPYLLELQERCREGLSRFREVRPSPHPKPARKGSSRAGKPEAPIAATGRLRRLKFEPRWTKERLGGTSAGRLLLSANGPIFVSPESVVSIAASGELRFKRIGTSGIAATRDEHVVLSDGHRLMSFRGAAASASWFRDHDALAFGPELRPTDGVWLTTAQSRVVLCLDPLTGRELWRIAPLRSQRLHLSVQGHRALIATDAGHLFGVELENGQLRYRVNAPLPFVAAPVAWGRRAVSVLGRRDATSVVVVDADSGALAWTCQLELSRPSSPLAKGRRVWIAGERGGEGLLVALSADGGVLWERPLPQERGPFTLLAAGTSTIVVGANGAASRLDAAGGVEWRVGAAGEERFDVAPVIARGVLVLPGDPIRAVDVHGGRILGEVKPGPGLCDLAVDRKLNLYLLDDRGTLQAYHLRSYFSVVEGRS